MKDLLNGDAGSPGFTTSMRNCIEFTFDLSYFASNRAIREESIKAELTVCDLSPPIRNS
ncbi:hypothetical protein [Phormidesmis sp. 146-33]